MTRERRRAACGRADAKDGLRGTLYNENVFRCELVCRVIQDVLLYRGSDSEARRRVGILQLFERNMEREWHRVIILQNALVTRKHVIYWVYVPCWKVC